MTARQDLPPLRAVIGRYGLSARRALGQNFILDLNLTRRIAREANVAGKPVYEVGPGPGGLTRGLLAEGASRVIAVERDERCLPALADIAGLHPGRLDAVSADAMTADEPALCRAHGVEPPLAVVANLPFNTGTALLVKWLTVRDWLPWWESLTLMFQREVAERICARPGSDAYGRLSVLAQWRAKGRILFEVPPQAFVPAPKVTAAVLRLEPLSAPRFDARLADLEKVTQAAFGQRRKMLRASLRQLTPDAGALLNAAGLEETERPESLTVEQFCALARAYRSFLEPFRL